MDEKNEVVRPHKSTPSVSARKEPTLNVDTRIMPTCSRDFNKDVIIGDDDVAYIPLEAVEQILVENEDLRETLFISLSEPHKRAYILLSQMTGLGTKQILEEVRAIELLTGDVLTGKNIFNFIYGVLAGRGAVNFRHIPSNTSKLQWLWKNGYLPQVSVLVLTFYHVLSELRGLDPMAFKVMVKAIKKELETKHKP